MEFSSTEPEGDFDHSTFTFILKESCHLEFWKVNLVFQILALVELILLGFRLKRC